MLGNMETRGRGTMVWRLARTLDEGDVTWRVEPPTPLRAPFPLPPLDGFHLHSDRGGDRLAVVNRFARVVVMPPPGRPGSGFVLNDPQVSFAAVSPDGRYVATGTWRGKGVKVWEADTGQPVRDLPAAESAGVGFTPDGSRLLVLESEGAYRSHRVGTWEQNWKDAIGHRLHTQTRSRRRILYEQ